MLPEATSALDRLKQADPIGHNVRFVPKAGVSRSAFLITYLTMICTVKH